MLKLIPVVLLVSVFAASVPPSALAQMTTGARVAMREVTIMNKADGSIAWATLSEGGKVIKIFRKASDFSEEDKEQFSNVYARFDPKATAVPYMKPKSQPLLSETEAAALLRKYDENGYYIYQNGDRKTFNLFLDFQGKIPGGVSYGEQLDTAVHETLHTLDWKLAQADNQSGNYYYYLINGKTVPVPFQGTFNRDAILTLLPPSLQDDTSQAYLTGKKGAQGLPTLLDELNAYAHGGNTEIALATGTSELQELNPGLQHFMLYLEYYLRIARTTHPEVGGVLAGDDFQEAILLLWRQAEDVLERSCASSFMISDAQGYQPSESKYLDAVYDPANISEMDKYFGGSQNFERPKSCVPRH